MYNGRGYANITLIKNGNKFKTVIHRLVAKAFIPNPENKPEVNHINGNKANNNVDNLEWCTRTYNIQHAFKNGLNPSIKYVYGELLKLREEFEEFKAH